MSWTRRDFLINGLRVGAALPVVPSLATGAFARSEADERILVVVQLSGGNDGLNTVIPHRQDAYYRLRPSLAQQRGALHALDEDHGLHPSMPELGRLHAEGRLAVVHGVGYPDPNRSHFRSMEIWHTADPLHPPGDQGWLGGLADQVVTAHPGRMAALQVGAGDLPLALRGREYFAPTIRDPRGMRLEARRPELEVFRDRLLEADKDARDDLAFLREAARSTYRAADAMEAMVKNPPPVDYPGNELGRRLQLVARLVAGNFGTRIFHVELTGFDTHARQAATHAALLAELSSALGAFQADLEATGSAERVVTFVFSEFGRRAQENASRGTDHGAAAPVFLMGTRVQAGVHGTGPNLEALVEGDVPYGTDFRRVYAALDEHWLGLRSNTGERALPVLKG